MKLLFNLFGIAVAGALGYMSEPSLRFQLTGFQPSATEIARNGNVVIQMPDGAPPIEVSSLKPEQLPQRIVINSEVKVTDAASGVSQTLAAGTRVKLVRTEGGNAVVTADEGRFFGSIPITETDLVAQIAANPPGTKPEPPPAAPVPVIPPAGDTEEPVKTPEPPPVPEPAPAPEPAPMPEPTPEPPPAGEPAAPPAAAGASDVVTAMQESIKSTQIKEFTFEQVLEWTAGADEIVDGETYQTGLASYKAETIFGEKTIQAKALVKAGKVQRWIWPKSGMEIK